MTPIEILHKLAADKFEVGIRHYEFSNSKWTLGIEKAVEGVKVQISLEGDNLDSLIRKAYLKLENVIEQGIPEMAGPLLDYQPPVRPEADNDIPF